MRFEEKQPRREVFLEKFKKLLKKKGYTSITEFINKWISSGETFNSLHERLLLEGFDYSKTTFFKSLRKYLTIPYDYRDEFIYKWDSIAKIKGFSSAIEMVKYYKKARLIRTEIAKEIGVHPNHVRILFEVIENPDFGWKHPRRKKRLYRIVKDKSGFSKTGAKERWDKKFEELGVSTLKEAIKKLKGRGMSYNKMAKFFGISKMGFILRRKRARLKGRWINK